MLNWMVWNGTFDLYIIYLPLNNCYIILEGFFFILSFFVGYILSFVSLRLRTFRLSARVVTRIERGCSRSRREDVTITDVIRKPRIVNRTGDVINFMPESDGLGILKKAVSWDLDLEESSFFFFFCCRVHARWLGQWVESWRWTNSQHSKNRVCLSLLVSKA